MFKSHCASVQCTRTPRKGPVSGKRKALDLQRFGRLVVQLREARDMSQDMLAERVGTHRNTVSNWELGKSGPSAANLDALSSAFHVERTMLEAALSPPREDQKGAGASLALTALELADRLLGESVELRKAAMAPQRGAAPASRNDAVRDVGLLFGYLDSLQRLEEVVGKGPDPFTAAMAAMEGLAEAAAFEGLLELWRHYRSFAISSGQYDPSRAPSFTPKELKEIERDIGSV